MDIFQQFQALRSELEELKDYLPCASTDDDWTHVEAHLVALRIGIIRLQHLIRDRT